MGKRNRGQQAAFRIGKNNQERPGISIEGEFDSCLDTFSNSSRRMTKAEKNRLDWRFELTNEYMNETRDLLNDWVEYFIKYERESKTEDSKHFIKIRDVGKTERFNNNRTNNRLGILEDKVKKNKSSIKNFNKPSADELTGIERRLSKLEGYKNNSRIKVLEDKSLDSRLTALENKTGKRGANDDHTGILERVSSLEEAVKLDHITPEHDADNNINFYINKNARLHQTQVTYNSDFWARISALEMKPHNLTVENIPEMLRELTVRVAALEA